MSHSEEIKRFQEITGYSELEASNYLQAFAWNMEDAAQAFFDPTTDETSVPSHNNSTFVQPHVDRPSNRIATLSSRTSDDDEDDDNRRQAFYVGGAEQGGSGQQVLGDPSKKKNSQELVKDLFDAARRQGAEVASAEDSASTSAGPQLFGGAGYRLGEDPNAPSSVVNAPEHQSSATELRVVVRTYDNGFTVDDGPLRSYDNPNDSRFLAGIRDGMIPSEIQCKLTSPNQHVNIYMESKMGSSWEPPASVFQAFSGSGNMLGHPVPRLTTAASATVNSVTPVVGPGPKVNEAEPTTQLNIRLPDGNRLVLKLNISHTVEDIRSAIISQNPQLHGNTFVLRTSYPTKELTNLSQTLKDADLLNATLIVRPV